MGSDNRGCGSLLRRHATSLLALVISVTLALIAGPGLGLPYEQVCTVFVAGLLVCLWLAAEPDMAVVSLLPLALFPLLGVLSSKDVASQYFSDIAFLLFGSFLLSIALQEANAHARLAMALLSRLPGSPHAVLGGFMLVSAFLSMFMSNTATASVMCPLAACLSSELRASQESDDEENPPMTADLEPFLRRLMLGIAYSCSIGGCATITGTGTNVAFSQVYFRLEGKGLSWGSWLLLGLPVTFAMLAATWLWLAFALGGLGLPPGYRIPMEKLQKRHREQPGNGRAQVASCAALAVTVLGWMFREPKFMPGWAELLPEPDMVSDGTLAMAAGSVLFFVPTGAAERGDVGSEPEGCGAAAEQRGTVLEWAKVQPRLPLGLLLLIGAGCSISLAFKESGLSKSLTVALASLQGWSNVVLVTISCGVAAAMSQVVSDVATALVLLPIVHSFAKGLQEDPLFMMLPLTFCCSLPFTLPISTPPNAIAFQTSGRMRQAEMVRLGAPLVLLGMAVVLLASYGFGYKVLITNKA